MQPVGGEGSEGMVVATPERVAFEYEVAGLGSRFLAQLIDLAILTVVFVLMIFAVAFAGSALGDANLTILIVVLLSFILFVGYFPVCEGIWSGQTLGKRALRIRVLGDLGEPVTLVQVGIRNLVRIVDFMPAFYGIGLITLFAHGGGKRLGDFAAGTIVGRERGRIRLKDLVASAEAVTAATVVAEPARPTSIWADRREPADAAQASQPAAATVPAPASGATATPYEGAVRRLDPQLRRFVVAYARRRHELTQPRREQLAQQVAPGLAALLPAEVTAYGPAAVLDGLAALVYAELTR
jgi:uncharacterized RDD family membrane protein YckC